MSNYATLKSAIQSAVYTNGNGEITGAGLQAVLLQIVNTVGDGYVFKGVATAGTSAGTPDANVFYIAPAGTYTNFGSSYTVPDGSIGVFTYNGSWSRSSVSVKSEEYGNSLKKIREAALSELPYVSGGDGYIVYNNGDVSTNTATEHSDYVDVEGITAIAYSRGTATSSTTIAGMAFYNSAKTYISGQRFLISQPESGYTDEVIQVPSNAKYARFSWWKEIYGFYAQNILNPLNAANRCVFAGNPSVNGTVVSFDYLYVTQNGIRDRYSNVGKNKASTQRLSFDFDAPYYLVLHEDGTFEMIASGNYSTLKDTDLILLFGSQLGFYGGGGLIYTQVVEQLLHNEMLNADSIHFSEGGSTNAIDWTNGATYSSSTTCYTDYIDVSEIDKLLYMRGVAASTTTNAGMAFYDSSKNFISGGQRFFRARAVTTFGYVPYLVDVPAGAVYARFTYWLNNKEDFYVMKYGTPASKALYMSQKSYEKDFPLLGKKVSIIGDSISCHGSETQTREQGYNAPYWIVKSVDVGNTIQSYVTWLDVYTTTDGTTPTNKTIGGVTLTAAMIGTLQSFTPVAGDVGKEIGVARWAAMYTNIPYWQNLFEMTGAELCNNASWSGSCICKVPEGNARHDSFVLSEAYSDYTIGRLAKRDDEGNTIIPDVVIIYRGTNDFVQTDGVNHETIGTPDMMTWTDITDEMNFTQCYIKTIQKVRAAYPNAYIILCTLNVFKYVNYSHFPSNNGVNTLPQYNDKIREIANLMGCGLIEFDKDGITWENCYPDFISDNATTPLHPNTNGHRVMGEKAFEDIHYIFNPTR